MDTRVVQCAMGGHVAIVFNFNAVIIIIMEITDLTIKKLMFSSPSSGHHHHRVVPFLMTSCEAVPMQPCQLRASCEAPVQQVACSTEIPTHHTSPTSGLQPDKILRIHLQVQADVDLVSILHASVLKW